MQEFGTPAGRTVASGDNLTNMVWANAAHHPEAVLFRRKDGERWADVTATRFAADTSDLARGLIAAGLQQGDRVALLARTRYEWTVLDFAIWAAGCITVPIYETSSAEQIEWILHDSGAVALVVETVEHRLRAAPVLDRLGTIKNEWQIDGGAGGAVADLTALGADVAETAMHERRGLVRSDDVATISYTSGTTGRPKGCVLTHRNLLVEATGIGEALPELMAPENSLLLFLPLAHVMARTIQCCCVYNRVTVGHLPDPSLAVAEFPTFAPTLLLSVPRVFEKIFNSAKQKAHASGRGRVFDAAEATAIAYSRAMDTGGSGITLRLRHALFDRLFYGRLRAALGGSIRAAVSGAAPLGERLGHFFRGAGLPVMEGYGLTETSAGATLSRAGAFKVGTVGRPFPGMTVRIADDGEVLLRGEMVFGEYWHNDDATRDALREGWFHTGDLGTLDDDGFLCVTGRKKDILVTAAGKNIAPAPLEDRIRAHPLISQCMVVGDARPFVAALITLDATALTQWCQARGKPAGCTAADLVDDPDLRAEIGAAVTAANESVSRAESIREFVVLPSDFSEEGGELTPTMKVKRAVVTERYADRIDALYG
jgi:long-chain acyl-CoA synthetase